MSTSIQVSWAQFEIPEHCPGVPGQGSGPMPDGCGCGCGCASCSTKPQAPQAGQSSVRPVRYATGEVVLEAEDIHAGGFGVPWGHTRSFANRLTENTDAGNG